MATRALHHAFELAERPSLAGLLRQKGLPPDVITLIRIAAGVPESLAEEVARTGRPPDFIREAAVLYIQQILFHPGADAYRILGSSPAATQEELSQHMRLLMKWLHPDHDRSGWESAFAERVSSAWNLLKSPERRTRLDLALAIQPRGRKRRSRRPFAWGVRHLPSIERSSDRDIRPVAKIAGRSAAALILVAIALAVLIKPQAAMPWLGGSTAPVDGARPPTHNGD